MKYADAKKEAAPHFILLPPSAFAPVWKDRPKGQVACGLRTIGAASLDLARANAEKAAKALHGSLDSDVAIEAYNDGLVREYVALGICDPNNVEAPPPWMKFPDSDVGFMTPEAQRHVFDELQKLAATKSVAVQPIDDIEVLRLSTMLAAGLLANLPDDLQMAHRRVLRGVFDDLLIGTQVGVPVEEE